MIRETLKEYRDRLDGRVVAALLTCAVSVTVLYYVAGVDAVAQRWPGLVSDEWGDLPLWGVRVGLRLLFYVALPFAVARGFGVRELHLGAPQFFRRVWMVAVLLAIVMPFVVAVSYTPRFSASYPQGHAAAYGWKQLIVWLMVYGVSYFTVEFFYRGFLLTMLEPVFGPHCIFIAMIPYVMIHFPKPPAETAGSIVTGIVLGAVALRWRSIWYGLLIHVTVGFSMELLALHHAHAFPFN